MSTLPDAIRGGEEGEVARLLAAQPELAAGRDESGVSYLLLALYHRRWRIAELVRQALPELDVFEAAALGDEERVTRLLELDPAAARSIAPDGFTALHLAAFFGHLDSAGSLLEAGADPDAVALNPSRVAPIHSAAAGGHRAVVALLLRAGANPNALQAGGFTALHAAIQLEDAELQRILLQAGANPAIPMPPSPEK